jgi:hypothetical protein
MRGGSHLCKLCSPSHEMNPPQEYLMAAKLTAWLLDKVHWQNDMGEWRESMEILWRMNAPGVPSPKHIEEINEIPVEDEAYHELKWKLEYAFAAILDNGTVTMRELIADAEGEDPASLFGVMKKYFIPGYCRD